MLHVILHPNAVPAPPTTMREVNGALMPVVDEPPRGLRFDLSFEQVQERFDAVPRMFLEPDGAFVWVQTDQRREQLDGLLVDDGERLLSVELKIACGRQMLIQLWEALDWPQQALLFQVVPWGVYMNEVDFCALLDRDK